MSLMMMALDAGAEDFNEEEDCYEVTTAPDDFDAVNEALTNRRNYICLSRSYNDSSDICRAYNRR